VHLARGCSSNMGPPFKVILARGNDTYMWSFFKVHLALVSVLNKGPPFKMLLPRVCGSIMMWPFKVLLLRGSDGKLCSFFFKEHLPRVIVWNMRHLSSYS